MIFPEIRSPAVAGQNAMLPGVCRFSVFSSDGRGFIGSSSDQRTCSFFIPRFFSSRRMTFAKGQTDVFEISEIVKRSGSSLFPVPIEEISGIPFSQQTFASSSFDVTLSIASAT